MINSYFVLMMMIYDEHVFMQLICLLMLSSK